MAQVGCLGKIIFEVSSSTVKTISNVQWAGSARYSTHNRHGTNALTEFTGLDPDAISFDLKLSQFLGTDPMTELSKLWSYERSGEAVGLAIGEKGYGKYKWSVVKHTIKFEHYDAVGNMIDCTVSVELKEYLSA